MITEFPDLPMSLIPQEKVGMGSAILSLQLNTTVNPPVAREYFWTTDMIGSGAATDTE